MLTQLEVFGLLPASPPKLTLPILDILGENPLQIKGIDGLEPVKADIITSPAGALDGELYSGSSIGKRNIVIKMGLNPNWQDQTIESLRAELYKYFMPRLGTRLRLTSTHLPTCEIIGYVENMDPNIFSKDPEIQISIICPKPDFVAVNESVVNGAVVDSGVDTTLIDYPGSVPSGLTLDVKTNAVLPSFSGTLFIMMVRGTTDLFEAHADIDPTHLFRLNSIPGDKYVRTIRTTFPEEITDNLLNQAGPTKDWPVLLPGENNFAVIASELGQTWELSYFARFGGL